MVELILLAGCTGPVEETAEPVDTQVEPVDTEDSAVPGPDVDLDGFAVEDGDCDDWNADVYPGAPEILANEVDEDCDGLVDELGLERGRVLLSEVMVTPAAVEDHRGEWLELQNLSEGLLELDGLVVATPWHAVEVSGHVEAGGWFVLGPNAVAAENGGVEVDLDYSYGLFNLDAGVLRLTAGDEELDRLSLAVVQVEDGISLMRRSASLSAEWCQSADSYGAGDLGTPGEANGSCLEDVDVDEDGYSAAVDCDDSDDWVNPGAVEVWYDGVDQDCDGNDADADGDGWERLEDCDESDASVNPEAAETWYDGVDQDCDGNDDDADADGWPVDVDCDEGDPSVYPGAAEVWDDGLDQDCDGSDEAPPDTGSSDTSPPDTDPPADTGLSDTGSGGKAP